MVRMTLHRLETTQVLPIGTEEAWAFFSDPRNLVRITPPDMRFEVTSDIGDRVYPGMMITYRLRPLLGIPAEWVTEITHVEEGRLFVDEQRLGPYRLWHHEHHFTPVPGGVEIRDLVYYAIPLGPLGNLVNRVAVRPRLERVFAFRRETLHRLFASAPRDASAPAPLGRGVPELGA